MVTVIQQRGVHPSLQEIPMSEEYDPSWDDDPECCKRGVMMWYDGVFPHSVPLCLEGCRGEMDGNGWTRHSCSASYRMFGELERVL